MGFRLVLTQFASMMEVNFNILHRRGCRQGNFDNIWMERYWLETLGWCSYNISSMIEVNFNTRRRRGCHQGYCDGGDEGDGPRYTTDVEARTGAGLGWGKARLGLD